MESMTCSYCHKNKAHLSCGLCHCQLCKKCVQFLDDGSFSFLSSIPSELNHANYCMDCFQSKVNPAQESYQKILARAKEVSVFYKKQHKQTRWFKRTEPPIEVLACDDENETILRLAFLAAQNNFNALLDLEISSKKVKQMGSYQTREWRGIATPYLIETKTSTNNLNP